ncbi:hypothetical protein LptCag_1147 [Leptospirillum ferriphilum]|uniref:Uncharacterized protein n=1 Tax=Leptospirillum ferriphilum TaxID=178606 RepID=A0A094X764_9BACT|nr:hypothetical protein LptCag_1147 [Leptospirillum ferriphilum]
MGFLKNGQLTGLWKEIPGLHSVWMIDPSPRKIAPGKVGVFLEDRTPSPCGVLSTSP